MNTDLVFMYQGKVSVLGFNITVVMDTDLVGFNIWYR